MRRALITLLVALVPASEAGAQGGDCLTADPPPVTKPAHPLRFGITPGPAGSAGVTQAQVAPVDQARTTQALVALRGGERELVLRLNRLFWADGEEGIARFAALVDGYARAGLRSEIQVRYHPPEGHEGDIAAWEQFVRSAVRALAPKPAVIGFSITNEANFPASPNTSDGAYEGVLDALVRGVIVARDEAARLGRPDVDVGFNVMWRWTPEGDRAFWEGIGERATPEFRRALSYVGLQVYPGLVWPPAPLPDRTAGQEVVEALTLVRGCFMPKAGLGPDVPLWVSENGYATNLGRDEASQLAALESTVRDVHHWSGELNVTDYRWFNLRDNNSDGTDLFAAVGLLRDDYTPKPAYGAFGALVAQLGTPRSEKAGRARARLRLRATRQGARGRVLGSRDCGGVVMLRVRARGRTVARRTVRVRPPRCAFHARLRPRRGVVVARFRGNRSLRPATARSRLRGGRRRSSGTRARRPARTR